MEKDENVAPGRTWQSLKERFKKRILTNLNKKEVEMMEKKDNEINERSSDEEEEGTPRKLYKESEDQKILTYIYENGLEEKVGGVKMWRQMEERRVLKRSAQSMKERYRKRIKPSFDDPLCQSNSASATSAILYNPDSSSPTRFRLFKQNYQTSTRCLFDNLTSRSNSPDPPNSRSNSPEQPNSRRRSPCNQTFRSNSPFNPRSNKNLACDVFLTSDLNSSTSQVVS